MTTRRFDFFARTGLLAAAALMVAVPAEAQVDDTRWLPWFGCWEPVGEVREDAAAPLLCVGPAEGGVELRSVLEGEVVASEMIRSDGTERPVAREGCEGWERSEFSEDGHRVFFETEQMCEGDFAGTTSSMIAMVSPFEWVDVQVAGASRGYNVTVLRYRAATEAETAAAGYGDLVSERLATIRTARVSAASPLTIDQVIEASGKVHRVGVEAWVVEHGEIFDINANQLVKMADGGVPESVIDMVVAMSYPEKFAIERGVRGDPSAAPVRTANAQDYGRYGPRHIYAGYGWNSLYFSPFSYGYSPYGYNSYGYGYGGRGFGGYGYWGYQNNIVYVQPQQW